MKIRQVGKFRILDAIGQGSFGKVYKGIDRTTNQEVALKFIQRRDKKKRDLDNLRQEIEILKKLQHPNIISLKDHIETQNEFIVVTQFAGEDLSVVLQKQVKFKTQKVRQYASQILSALLYLSQNRIVHRDLKPQNILIKEGVIKICDFGFARKMSAMTMQLHSLKGTPLYIAPQIVNQKPYNHKVDIWSLGIIIYELAVGRPPFFAQSYNKLIPKILKDKVRYPKDMDLSLRQLIDGMLQKSPTSRYDWQHISNHPFMKTKAPLNQIVYDTNGKLDKQVDEFEECFPMDPKIFRSSALFNNKDRAQISELKQYEEQIKQGKQIGKQLKTNIVFYYQLISLFSSYSSGETVSKQYLILAMRIISRLVSQVKLEGDCRDDDITKKHDLLYSIINMIPNLQDTQVQAQAYSIVGYLLKNNFDAMNFDMDSSQKFIDAAKITLQKDKVDKTIYSNIVKVLGILAAQSLITLKNSQEFFVITADSKILASITKKFIDQKEVALILFQCVSKFIHPMKGQAPTKTSQFLTALTDLKLSVASGFASSQCALPYFLKMIQTFSQSQLTNFNSTMYECIKLSQEFRRVLNSKYLSIIPKIPVFNIPMGYYMMKFQMIQAINIDLIKMQISKETQIDYPIHRAFQINLLILTINTKSDATIKTQQMKFYLKKIAQILKLQDTKKQKSIESLEGWAFNCLPYKFDDIAISAFMQLYSLDKTLEKEFFKTCEVLNIFENMVKINKEEVNISFKYFSKILPFLINHIKSTKPSKKLIQSISQALFIYLSPEEIGKLKSNQPQKEVVIQFLQNCFCLIQQMVVKDDKKLSDFFTRSQNIGLHRLIMQDQFMNEKLLPYSLKLLYKVMQKSPPSVLDFLAVSGIKKLQKYCKEKTNNVTLQIIQIISHLARAKSDYYPNISQMKIIELIPKWLFSQNQQLTYRTLNLVGNLAKHSTFFFQQFSKYNVVSSIVNSIHYTKNYEKNVIYAIGNISFYNQQFKQQIRPVVPYLAKTLDLEDEHMLSNSISTLSNLLRHSNSYVKELIQTNTVTKILSILQKSKNTNTIQLGLNFLLKAMNYKQMWIQSKESIKRTLRKIICAIDSQIFRKIQKIEDKLKAS